LSLSGDNVMKEARTSKEVLGKLALKEVVIKKSGKQ
jgi:hypothetical protein